MITHFCNAYLQLCMAQISKFQEVCLQ